MTMTMIMTRAAAATIITTTITGR